MASCDWEERDRLFCIRNRQQLHPRQFYILYPVFFDQTADPFFFDLLSVNFIAVCFNQSYFNLVIHPLCDEFSQHLNFSPFDIDLQEINGFLQFTPRS